MSAFIDLTGKTFGHLTVLCRANDKILRNGVKKPMWLCQCDCGNIKEILGESLRNGKTTSCGCHRGDSLIAYSTKHGKRYERIYSIFCDIKKRCYNPNSIGYKNYGEKGIRICDEWLGDFESFYTWSMEHGYPDTLTIDRIDSSGNYEPSNCRWIPMAEQYKNKQSNWWKQPLPEPYGGDE